MSKNFDRPSMEAAMSLPMRLDARLVAMADRLTAGIPLSPPRVVDRLGSPAEQVLRCLRSTVRTDEGADEAQMLAACEYVGKVRAVQLASLYRLGAEHF